MHYSLETAVWSIQRFFNLSRKETGDGNSHQVSEGWSSLIKCTHLAVNMPDS